MKPKIPTAGRPAGGTPLATATPQPDGTARRGAAIPDRLRAHTP